MYSWVTTEHLKQWTGAISNGTWPSQFRQISTDSRSLQKGDVFLAIKGDAFDGHDYIAIAQERGAIGCIAEKSGPANFPILRVGDSLKAFVEIGKKLRENFMGPVFAITGSAGKSSTKEMLATLLGPGTLASPASFNNLLGLSKTCCLLDEKTERVVFEMGMNAKGEIAELCESFRPLGGCITNIGDAHIGRLGGQEGVYQAKKELFDHLASKGCSLGVVLSSDERWVMRAFQESFKNHPTIKKLTYGRNDKVDVQIVKEGQNSQSGLLEVALRYRFHTFNASLPIFGMHHVGNLAAAVSAALLLETPIEKIQERLSSIRPALHRGEIRKTQLGGILIDESYNSNPTALKSSLQSLGGYSKSIPLLLVIGEMRELDAFAEKLHREVGAFLLQLVKDWGKRELQIIGVGKQTQHLLQPLKEAGVKTYYCDEVQEATRQTKSLLCSDLLTFIKGSRGNRLDELIEAISQ